MIDGKSSSYFYIFDLVASVIAGFSFVINGYIPMVLCFICCVISTIISFKFRHTTILQEKVKPVTFTEYKKQLKDSLIFIKSKRMRNLILFNAVFIGTLYGIVNLRSSMLSEMNVPEQYFGIIFAILQLVAALATRQTDKIHNSFRNKTLTYLGVPLVLSCICIGLIGQDRLSYSF